MRKKRHLVIKINNKSACELPTFYAGLMDCTVPPRPLPGKYHFDSYGQVPPNYKEYDRYYGYGMCGSHGHTDRLKVIAKSIRMINKHDVGLCDDKMLAALKEKYPVEVVEWGFK